jgi:tRNA pseudouridine-54 N-methylase
MSMGDADGVSEITDELLRFNDRYPQIAITPSTIKKSMEQHRKTTQEMHHGITVSKPMRDRVLRMAEEYEDSEE